MCQKDDVISRADAIDALRMDIDIIPYAKAREYARAVIETVYNRLEELPSAQQWIPCSERPPEEKSDWKTVTVLDESGDTPFTYTSVGYYLSDGWWIVDNEPMEEGNLIRVIAWMPLPEPWKGERE